MEKMFIVTGSAGHLGSVLIRKLTSQKISVRGLILPGENPFIHSKVSYINGDIRNYESLQKLFSFDFLNYDVYVIHAAGKIDISQNSSDLYNVNVLGTQNMINLCMQYPVKKFIYVSSVHAIAEQPFPTIINEPQDFSPTMVVGNYAKTKSEATKKVLDSVKDGLNSVVVLPSGIIGPYADKRNYLIKLFADYLENKLPACVDGGYDFVDVRDVADGCLLAAEKSKNGESYILSNQYCKIEDLLNQIRTLCKKGKKLPVLPTNIAKLFLPLAKLHAAIKQKPTLYTSYSLYTLKSNGHFSHEKANRVLGYSPRNMSSTLYDTVKWMYSSNIISQPSF